MKSLLILIVWILFAVVASAQCPNGQCQAPRTTITVTYSTAQPRATNAAPVRTVYLGAPVCVAGVCYRAAPVQVVAVREVRRVGPVRGFFGWVCGR